MRPLFILSAGAIASLATLGAVAFAQTPRAPAAASVTPPPPGPPTAAPGAPPSAPPSGTAPPTGAAPTSPSAPTPAAGPPLPAPPAGPPAGGPAAPGATPPGAPPLGPQPPVYGPPPGYPGPYGYPPMPYYPAPYGAPPPPAVPLDAHSHTGFFLRMGIGGGYVASSTTLEGAQFPGKVDAAGGAFTLELDIGGALSPGLILAGSYTVHSVGNAKLTNDTRTYRPAHDPTLTLLSAMLDVYPNPKSGFHFGGALGLASLRERAGEDAQASSDGQNGLGLAPHVGYEWWVGNYWGIGVLGRFVYARTKGDYADGTETDSVTGGTILFSATYN